MMTTITNSIMMLSLATAYGKNGLPFAFSSAYSRRYSSFSRWFISDLFLAELLVDVGPLPRRRGRAELGDEVEVGTDEPPDQPGHEQHVDRVEPRQGGCAEVGTTP